MNKTNENSYISNLIHSFAKKNIHVEVLCDSYKLNMSVCYRGYVTYKEGHNWIAEDMGCFDDWDKAFSASIKYATEISCV